MEGLKLYKYLFLYGNIGSFLDIEAFVYLDCQKMPHGDSTHSSHALTSALSALHAGISDTV